MTSPSPHVFLRWNALERTALRFLVCYLLIYSPVVLCTLGFLGLPVYWYDLIWSTPVQWTANALHLNATAPTLGHAPGSPFYQLAESILFMGIAAVATAIWSTKPASPQQSERLHQWLRLGLRYLLAYVAIHYASVALFRYQFGDLSGEALATPVGDLHAREFLWAFLGWNVMYTTFLAIIEFSAGALLLRRATTLLGAICMAILLSNVIQLNFLFDVPEKSLSPHLTLMVGILLLPDLKRVFEVHFLGEPVAAANPHAEIPNVGWMRRHHRALKSVAVLAFVASPLIVIERGRGSLFPLKGSPLSGLYDVTNYVSNSDTLPKIVGDTTRWTHVVVPAVPNELHVQLMDGSWRAYNATIDSVQHRIALGDRRTLDWRDPSTTRHPSPTNEALGYKDAGKGALQLQGTLRNQRVSILLTRVGRESLKLYTDSWAAKR